jgi:hypothetical protein
LIKDITSLTNQILCGSQLTLAIGVDLKGVVSRNRKKKSQSYRQKKKKASKVILKAILCVDRKNMRKKTQIKERNTSKTHWIMGQGRKSSVCSVCVCN